MLSATEEGPGTIPELVSASHSLTVLGARPTAAVGSTVAVKLRLKAPQVIFGEEVSTGPTLPPGQSSLFQRVQRHPQASGKPK